MSREEFSSKYNKLIKNKTKAEDILKYLKPNTANISIPQLNMFLACYKSESTTKKELTKKLQFL